ncbi:MAG: PKD domain-containing protein [Solirubrobacterales bacterium]
MSLAPSIVRAAEPNGFGELTRFGETGALGESGKLGELNTRALGVDPTDNSVYLLDEAKEATETKRVFRLQKFTASPVTHKYALSASVQFTDISPSLRKLEPQVEGLAVDPAWEKEGVKHEGRVYLLAVDAREKSLGVDEAVDNFKKGEGLPVASTLYAFSTKEAGSQLIGAGKEGEHNEVLTGPAELEAQSKTKGKALLEPRGITIDTSAHEVIVLGHIDEKGEKEDALSSSGDHYVVQRIEATGKLGERYLDSTDFLKNGFKPHSPVVVIAKNAKGEDEPHLDVGHVVEGVENISEVPYDFKAGGAPHTLTPEPAGGVVPGVFGSSAGSGGRLAAAPDGTIWGMGSIRNEAAGEGLASVVGFSGATGAEIGWTGGQQRGASATCSLEDPEYVGLLPQSLSTPVAAGSGGKVFVLAPEFLLRQEEVIEEVFNEVTEEFEEVITFVPLAGPFFPAVVELGPGGSGCPPASATAPVARVSGIEVKGEEPVRPGTEVTFSSQIKQADALSVEWDFGDGAKQTISTDQFQTSTVKHKYDVKGKYTVTEKIRLDDLADPTQPVWEGHLISPVVTKTQTININNPVPTAKLTAPGVLAPGQSGTFDGSTSTDPNKSPITGYAWSFGDGTPEVTTAAASTTHAYASPGAYTAALVVTDQLGLSSLPSRVTVVVEAAGGGPPPPPPPPPPPGGGGGSQSPGGGGTPNPGGGSGGVLSYKLSVAGTSLTVSSAGAFVLKLNCQGQSSCTGTVTLRTASAVSAAGHKILTLASGSFSAAGGSSKALSLHLSAKARTLLAHLHTLKAKATIVARDAQGATHTTPLSLTLRAAAKTKHH